MIGNVAIKVENLSKAYQLGQFNTGALVHDLKRWWALKRGKDDPFLTVGETNDRTVKSESNIVWSLKDLDFQIEQGDAVGIIGRNGAGKSTLLKLLSSITSPTTGEIKIKGRIASLLEVGTGFHPELTGRENIFLNGAILGMRKSEIRSKFDEIVDFAGVERYIDTPVKRYSSGMYVRLAFAVAAHLESEILIVDEVLAVGDASFQKKCLGKMSNISKMDGRTVLFVSHNLGAVQSLCNKGLLLDKGLLKGDGIIGNIINAYNNLGILSSDSDSFSFKQDQNSQLKAQILEGRIINPKSPFDLFDEIKISFKVLVNQTLRGCSPMLKVKDSNQDIIKTFATDYFDDLLDKWEAGEYLFEVTLPNIFKKGYYSIDLEIGMLMAEGVHLVQNNLQFEIDELSFNPSLRSYYHIREGIVTAKMDWKITSN